jgi:hypothetical protein
MTRELHQTFRSALNRMSESRKERLRRAVSEGLFGKLGDLEKCLLWLPPMLALLQMCFGDGDNRPTLFDALGVLLISASMLFLLIRPFFKISWMYFVGDKSQWTKEYFAGLACWVGFMMAQYLVVFLITEPETISGLVELLGLGQ